MTSEVKKLIKFAGWISIVGGALITIFVVSGYGDSLAKKYIRASTKTEFVSQEVYLKDQKTMEANQREINEGLKKILSNMRSINATFASKGIKMINVEVE